MSFDSRPKDNPLNWSFRIGSLFGISIRLHLFFLLGAVYIVGLSLKNASDAGSALVFYETLGVVGLLFFIVLVHEFGHCWGAIRTGGEAEEILLWPLGGLAMVRPKHTAYAHFITAVSGPMVNVIFCAVSAVALVILHGGLGAVPWNPLDPFMPVSDTVNLGDVTQRWLRIFFTVSYVILLFNLLPIYPLDGGRVLHCSLWPKKGYRDATMAATFVGMVGAIALGIVGLLTGAMLMIAIAFFGYLTCYNDRRVAKYAADDGENEFGYDFSKGYAAFEEGEGGGETEKKPGFLARRRQAKEEARRQHKVLADQVLRQRVDAILTKVHQHGMDSLTSEEHRILREETERQRTDGS